MLISSIGFLSRADGDINLTPCVDGNSFPTIIKVTASEYAQTKGVKEKMIELALSKFQGMQKRFNIMFNVGRAKYVVNFHNGVSTHKDGSDFFGIATFSNKVKFNAFQKELLGEGYTQNN